MTSTHVARLFVAAALIGGFTWLALQLSATAPKSKRTRPEAPVPLVDVVETRAQRQQLTLQAAGTVISAMELDIRPQLAGRILALHPDFEPGGRIPAGEVAVTMEADEFQLAVAAAEAEIAKAKASIALEQGRRRVAREELDILKGSIKMDSGSQALALRKPQLNQVKAELAAAQNNLDRALLDLERTQISLPFDVVVLERTRVAGEVVAARELLGRVARADEYWLELRTRPRLARRIQTRNGEEPGSRVVVDDSRGRFTGEVIRIRADLAEGSRLAGLIVAIPVNHSDTEVPLLGAYVQAEIEAGTMDDLVAAPRRALRDNARVWVVDNADRLQVRDAKLVWESGPTIYLDSRGLLAGDQIVVSRVSGLIPGTTVRHRRINPETGIGQGVEE